MNYPAWVALSGGTRRAADGAANAMKAAPDTAKVILQIEGDVREAGVSSPSLIAVAEGPGSPHVLVEGHHRGTGYLRALEADSTVDVYVGYVNDLSSWKWI
jgi:hypothetical protein